MNKTAIEKGKEKEEKNLDQAGELLEKEMNKMENKTEKDVSQVQ